MPITPEKSKSNAGITTQNDPCNQVTHQPHNATTLTHGDNKKKRKKTATESAVAAATTVATDVNWEAKFYQKEAEKKDSDILRLEGEVRLLRAAAAANWKKWEAKEKKEKEEKEDYNRWMEARMLEKRLEEEREWERRGTMIEGLLDREKAKIRDLEEELEKSKLLLEVIEEHNHNYPAFFPQHEDRGADIPPPNNTLNSGSDNYDGSSSDDE